jgi:4-hydroxy-3-polyprenylbenzoate decarboxylase
LKQINAVDAAGVHPLLLAIGSERYTPYLKTKTPSELLTISNRILGTGQLSLAKFLFITADDSNKLSVNDIPSFFQYCLERIDLSRDVHFQTMTSIDTLDYSGTGLNSGSKVVLAAYGDIIRKPCNEVPAGLKNERAKLVLPGIIALKKDKFISYENANKEMGALNEQLKNEELGGVAMIIVCDDADFVSDKLNNFLWVTFTRSNPSHDIYGINSFTGNKHWGCKGPLVIDARIKPHHAPPLEKDPVTEKRIASIFEKGGSLFEFRDNF